MRLCPVLMASLVVIAAPFVGAASDAGLRPSWECLPAGTAVMLRLPDPAGFLEATRTRTKFGAVALSDQRLRGTWNLLLDKLRGDGGTADLEELEKSLAKYDLRTDDLTAGLRGDLGAGFVFRARERGLPPLVMMLAWLEPGEETATRLVTAAQRRMEEDIAADTTDTSRRTDLEMAGHEVLWMIEPVLGIDPAAMALDDLQLDPNDEDAVEKRLAELQDRIRNAKPVKTGVTHAFLTRAGGRLILGQTLPATSPKGAPGAAADDENGGEELAKETFERFLAAHAGTERGAIAEALDTPGMATTLPAGLPLLDLVVDPRVLVETAGDEALRTRLEGVGLAGLGPIAWRQALDDGRYRSGVFASLPGPRTGLMRILDQDCDAAEVPSFVNRESIDFTQISLDLGQAYETVKETLAAQPGGDESLAMLSAVEMQAQGWLGIELPRLLSALGSRHWIVSYPPRVAEAFAEARRARDQEAGQKARQIADRVALVWRIGDEAAFGKLVQRLAGLVGGELQEEQGFRGVRVPDGPAVFLGQDHLVVGIGSDSLEKTLTAIRNPPAGDASLRESEVPRRAADLLPLDASRMVGISDSTQAGGTLGAIRDMVRALVPEDVEEPYRDLLAAAQKLLPTDEEMAGMFGVGATTLKATADGVALESAWEMPAP